MGLQTRTEATACSNPVSEQSRASAALRSCGKRLRTLDLAVPWSGTKEPARHLWFKTHCIPICRDPLLSTSRCVLPFPRLAADVLRLLYHRLRDYRMLNVQIYLASSHHDFCCKLHKNSPAPSALPHRWPRARPSERARQHPHWYARPTNTTCPQGLLDWPCPAPNKPPLPLWRHVLSPVLRHQPSQIAERGVQQPQSRHTLTRHEQAVSRNEAQARKFHAELRH